MQADCVASDPETAACSSWETALNNMKLAGQKIVKNHVSDIEECSLLCSRSLLHHLNFYIFVS
jgi:hypothetical protein